ncbi:hypothetical protein CPB84DRAFT_1383915 [Gymnopilus junonius]|uniref:Uncharacterized protein n=1 Tax=Gymnopilus junonius TaxID=109634 RepID=A0A9P5NIT4_GYMJU|nr:hypothetical protein CPB84DRAFT_1383915 [Gymnopilus junonius]
MKGDYSYDVPQGVTLQQCVQGSEWSLTSLATPSSALIDIAQTNTEIHEQSLQSKTSFDLPLSSETLFFLTRGQLLGGILHVETSPNQAQDSAKVNIVIRYDRPELRDLTKACVLSRRQGENGIGVFAPIWRRYPGSRYSIRFEMTIILPEPTRSSAPFVIKNFETDIPNSAHMLDDLNGLASFDSISLRGSNGIIKADSLNATKGKIHTSNGGISGKFHSTHELVLETSNGPIKVAVELESDESSPSLKARTSNGLVEAGVSLLSASASGGTFDVSLRTSNAPLRASFRDSPVDSHLKFEATTSNSPAFVSLNPAYEGSFHLRTSSSEGPAIRRRSGIEDPTGKGRSRQVVYKLIGKKESIGDIYWGDKKTPNGMVDVRTSNGHLSLEV